MGFAADRTGRFRRSSSFHNLGAPISLVTSRLVQSIRARKCEQIVNIGGGTNSNYAVKLSLSSIRDLGAEPIEV